MDVELITKNRKYYQKRLAFILEEISRPTQSVLDLGCGEMILRELISSLQCRDYLGVDESIFSHSDEFIQADVVSFMKKENRFWEYVFCLGLIDHLSKEDGEYVIQRAIEISKTCAIISIANSGNIFLKLLNWFNNKKFAILPKSSKRIYLLKIPFTQILFKISSNRFLQKYFSTEIIYFVQK